MKATEPPQRPPRGVTGAALERFMHDLERDRVTTAALARRIYRVTITAATTAGATAFTRDVERTVHANRRPATSFLAFDPREQRLGGPALRHLAGVTAMRHALGAAADDWENHADRARAPLIPDALWTPPHYHPLAGGTNAIEYDAGSYNPQRVYEKLSQFAREFSAQVWGVATDARADTLRRATEQHGIDATILVTPWWA